MKHGSGTQLEFADAGRQSTPEPQSSGQSSRMLLPRLNRTRMVKRKLTRMDLAITTRS